MSIPADLAVASILSRGPTRIGTISPRLAASIAPVSADSSQGCTTAVGIGFRFLHVITSLHIYRFRFADSCLHLFSLALRTTARTAGLVSLLEERQKNCDRNPSGSFVMGTMLFAGFITNYKSLSGSNRLALIQARRGLHGKFFDRTCRKLRTPFVGC